MSEENKMIDGEKLLECLNEISCNAFSQDGVSAHYDFFDNIKMKIKSLMSEAEATTKESSAVKPSEWQVGDKFYDKEDPSQGVLTLESIDCEGLWDSECYFNIQPQDDSWRNIDAERRTMQAEIDRLKREIELRDLKDAPQEDFIAFMEVPKFNGGKNEA